ncbi:MAG TPA: Uma2 family endonuclease [Caulobacterales bacterium]|jgi:Uma2 family endonuclease|nr:Uma2 family endonuclease [Caulobacterales bacterium]
MNVPLQPTTITRHRFTVDDIIALTAQGFVDKRAQLLDGEIYDMPADGDAHIRFTMALARRLMRALSDNYFIGVQTTLRLSEFNAPSPDLYVLAGGPPAGDVSPENILLVIEVADTSLNDDLGAAASRYGAHGVRDYWVVDVNTRAIFVHRSPRNGAYPPPTRIEANSKATALLVDGFSLSLAEI